MIALPRRSFLRSAAALLPTALGSRLLHAAPNTGDDSVPLALPKPLAREEDRYAVKRALPNGTTTFKVSSQDCRNDFFAMEHHHTAKGGPPLHRHHVEDEWWYVLEGEYRVKIGDTLHTLQAGDSILGPRGIPHAFAFVGPASGRVLITYAPAGRMEEYFSFQDQHGGRSYSSDAERARAFGIDRLGPPLSVD